MWLIDTGRSLARAADDLGPPDHLLAKQLHSYLGTVEDMQRDWSRPVPPTLPPAA